ncbi:MAG: hypothetical protein PVI98_08000 [Burkholderiales bacterium]|jgi:hypothetical protein
MRSAPRQWQAMHSEATKQACKHGCATPSFFTATRRNDISLFRAAKPSSFFSRRPFLFSTSESILVSSLARQAAASSTQLQQRKSSIKKFDQKNAELKPE